MLAIRHPWARAWVVGTAAVAVTMLLAITAGAQPQKRSHKRHMMRIETQGAFLGVTMQDLTDELREGLDSKAKNGVLVSSVVDGSAAEKAGIEAGDIIVEIDGQKIESSENLREIISDKEVGDQVKVKYFRKGKSKTVDVALGDFADHAPMLSYGDDDHFNFAVPDGEDFRTMVANLRPRRLGVQAHEMDKDLSSYFGVSEGEGVLVLGVEEETTAEKAGIKAGDVIVGINEDKVSSIGDIREAMSEHEKGDKISITVVRKNKREKLEAEVQESKNVWVDHLQGPWQHPGMHMREFGVPDDLRKEIDNLREEVDQLKKELNKS